MKFKTAVMGTHFYVPRRELTFEEEHSLRKDLCVKPRYNPERKINLIDDMKVAGLGLPRHYFKEPKTVADKILDIRQDGRPLKFDFLSELRPGQPEVIYEFSRVVNNGTTGIILEAPPGFGKTVCIIKMLKILGRTALVVVPRSNLIKQWIDRLLEHSSLLSSEIGWVEGGKADYKGKKVVVGLVHTLALDRLGREFRNQFGTVVFDEVDRSVPPETFAPVVTMFPARYRLGASATIKRTDGMDVVFNVHIGQVVITGADTNRMKPKVLVHLFDGSSGYVHEGSPKLNRRGMLLSRLAENENRNKLIAKYIKMIYVSGRRILVLSDRTAQLATLRLMVAKIGISLNETGFYVRTLPKGQSKRTMGAKDRERVAIDCKVIFATYGMIHLGTDIPDLAGLIYATPQSEVRQSKGRIERICEGKLTPVVVDIVDTYYPDAMNWSYARQRRYTTEGLTVKFRGGEKRS